jgi:signal transduction histidine kinase
MSSRAWYRSLYWRIALGFVLFLSLLLAVQVALTFWVIGRAEEAVPPQRLAEYTALVASDISAALEADPHLDLDEHLRNRYGALARPTFVIMADGRVAGGRWGEPPAQLVQAARERLARPMPGGAEAMRRGRGGRPGPFAPFAPIIVNGQRIGMVVVEPRRPPGMVLRELGPLMGAIALVLVVGGGVLAALLIFSPAQRRLRGLEDAARNFGRGDRDARAPETGGDEIAAVALTFNRMADDLARRASQLEAADRARRQLLADVSHELTTPLTAIRGYVETLAMPDLELDDAAQLRYLAIISDETMRLERIVGDLLDLAKLEAGGVTLKLQEVAVADLFERVVARHERPCQDRQVTLATAIEPGADIVRADPDRLEQALQNLAANALRHTPDGGRIDLQARPSDGEIVVAVRDTGKGIAAEHLPFIFDRFYKADASRTNDTAGSGLGLSIVKAIVEQHGGSVTAASTPGVETVFEIRLPAAGSVSAGRS